MSHIRSARLCARLLLAVLLAVLPATALAAPPPAAAPSSAALQAERARLRADLDRVNAEIDALKKAGRGVGGNYRLRARMADAEALARRLIDIEARLGLRAPAPKPGPLPAAAPTDGPGDLEAKADILADQSRRVRAEAEALDRRVADLKGRQALRRRAADLDRDPFAPLEGSKRRVASIAGGADSNSGSHVAGPSPSFNPAAGVSPMPPGDHPGASVSVSSGAVPPTGGSTPPPVPSPSAPPTALSLELRDLLDPATVADIRRLEGTRASGSSIQALEHAVSALRARASALDGEARTMRDRARTPR
jgi:hypothetical protein